MSQEDYNVANAAPATVRADLNAILDAIATNNSGASAPTTTFANMWWYDTAGILYQRNATNTAWVLVADVATMAWYLNGDAAGGTAFLDELGLELPSQAEAEAGAATTARRWTAERVKQAITALAPGAGGVTLTWGTPVTINPYALATSNSGAHGLGGYPDGVEIYLECIVTQVGWAVGDRMHCNQGFYRYFHAGYDATTLYLYTKNANPPVTLLKSNGNLSSITASSWKLVAVPYKLA